MFVLKQCRDDKQDAAHHTTSPKKNVSLNQHFRLVRVDGRPQTYLHMSSLTVEIH
jgi:hypothetical protein